MLCFKILADFQSLFENMDHADRKARLNNMVYKDPQSDRWICRICNDSVKRKTIAIDHIEGVHLRIPSYSCEYCDSVFTCLTQRRRHVHANHREQNKLTKCLEQSLAE